MVFGPAGDINSYGFPAVRQVRMNIKIEITLARIRPQTRASEGKRQSGPSLGTPRGRGDKNKSKSVLKYSWGLATSMAPDLVNSEGFGDDCF
jgi:hypothetical protein